MTFEDWWEQFVAEHADWQYADSEALRKRAFEAGSQAEREGAEMTTEWINTKDRLPTTPPHGFSDTVLITTNYGNVLLGRYDSHSRSWEMYNCEDHECTHWTPLPHPPKELK